MALVLSLSVSTTSSIKEYWQFDPSWLEYVKSTWAGVGRVELVHDDSAERLAFLAKSAESFDKHGIKYSQIKTYLSVQQPSIGDGYDEGFPHIHHPLSGTSLIHYLQPGDKPAPLHIFDECEVVEEIYPEKGLSVLVPHHIYHGVLRNQGTIDRIQLIASAI